MRTKQLYKSPNVLIEWRQEENWREWAVETLERFYMWGLPVAGTALAVTVSEWFILLAVPPAVFQLKLKWRGSHGKK